jgi:hypothetical protein
MSTTASSTNSLESQRPRYIPIGARRPEGRGADATGGEATTASLDALEIIEAQHVDILALIDELESGEARAKRQTAKQLIARLQMHTKLEHKIFYPAVKRLDVVLALEAEEEHAAVDTMIRKLSKRGATDVFEARTRFLCELVRHHIAEEERLVLPMVEREIDAQELAGMGRRMLALMRRGRGAGRGKKPSGRARTAKRKAAKGGSRSARGVVLH